MNKNIETLCIHGGWNPGKAATVANISEYNIQI